MHVKQIGTVVIALTTIGILVGCGTVKQEVKQSVSNTTDSTSNPTQTFHMVVRKLTPAAKNSMNQLQSPNAVWQDGNWVNPKNANLNGPRYVMTAMLQPQNNINSPHTNPAIIIYRENAAAYGGGQPEQTIYKCPNNIGNFNITHISKDGAVLYWKSDKGQSGTFNLKTYKWSFQ
ncbi:hypothetical protein [Alicyclobacillus mengziensis]|uniref:Lipoprotein n=1 Tax=Alicyclobacillus mengziensis TaxID=2931921 RepID=A0A9X7VX85_9BACL|nr:hypothetical protein [Alicyclobacillus mengziensis]QSO46746.1 hypothetical protein JZ786_20255 [Alicyclobacillus mengziensis]